MISFKNFVQELCDYAKVRASIDIAMQVIYFF